MTLHLLYSFLLFFALGRAIRASYGDYEPYYQHCLQSCWDLCNQDTSYLEDETYPPFNLPSIVTWKCPDRCHYVCMNSITVDRLSKSKSVYKYYGHWPFLRWFGMEEPASAIFSLLNAIPHLSWLLKRIGIIQGKTIKSQWFMFHWLNVYAVVAINAWIASTLFHMKKDDRSIFYDYTSALLLLTTGLWLIVRRIGSYNMPRKVLIPLLIPLYTYTFYRIYLMYYFPRSISFHQHLRYCIGLAAITTILWVVWILYCYCYQHWTRSLQYAIAIQVWFIIASMFEVFDFPPFFRTFDAHSCWHGLTIPLGFLFYSFWEIDYEEFTKKEKRIDWDSK